MCYAAVVRFIVARTCHVAFTATLFCDNSEEKRPNPSRVSAFIKRKKIKTRSDCYFSGASICRGWSEKWTRRLENNFSKSRYHFEGPLWWEKRQVECGETRWIPRTSVERLKNISGSFEPFKGWLDGTLIPHYCTIPHNQRPKE